MRTDPREDPGLAAEEGSTAMTLETFFGLMAWGHLLWLHILQRHSCRFTRNHSGEVMCSHRTKVLGCSHGGEPMNRRFSPTEHNAMVNKGQRSRNGCLDLGLDL